jgi:protease IV
MPIRIVFLLLLTAGLALAEPTARPTTQPAEAETTAQAQEQAEAEQEHARPAGRATEAPATQPAADAANGQPAPPTTAPAVQAGNRFPTPAELVERIRQMQEAQDSLLKVAYFDLSSRIVERPADFSLFGDGPGETLRSVVDRLHKAREDNNVRAALLTIRDPGLNLSQAQEIRDALIELRRAGKKTFVYADSYNTVTYTLASGATNVCMLGAGEIVMPGIGVETMFARGLLDMIGVKADYIQIGEYKGADEQFTRTEPTEELRGELNRLVDALYAQIIDGISLQRNLTRENVRQLVDEAIINASLAKQRGLVDHLVDIDGLRELITEELGDQINLVHGYGKPERPEVDFSNPFALFATMAQRPEPTGKPAVALIYADGMIVEGRGGEGLFGGGGVGSEDLRQALRVAGRDEQVRAVVIRVDSPGGSPLASEIIWQAARRVAEDKPVIISIGSMAASGGYYVASAGDHIFADSTAIIGSIGVVGGKFVLKDLYDKIGLKTEAFHRGRNADLFSSTREFDERQRRMITNWMRQTYEQFTDRIMATRSERIRNIDQVARGRIFIAGQALELGMIDQIGGVEDAIAHAADKAGMQRGEFEVRILPAPRSLADLFLGGADTQAPVRPQVTINADSMLHILPPSMRRMLGQQVMIMEMMEQRPVMLISPYIITVR